MQREFDIKGVHFEIANYRPRKNEFERGLKYQLFVNGYSTGYYFETINKAKEYARKNYFVWM